MENLSDLEVYENSNLNKIELPYVIKDHPIFSPGTHNEFDYSAKVIQNAYVETDWNNRTKSLYLDHDDEFTIDPRTGEKTKPRGANVKDWVGEVKNIKMRNDEMIGDLYVVDMDTAIKLEYGAHFGVSPRGKGKKYPGSNKVVKMLVENFSIVINPAIKSTYFNFEMEDINKSDSKESHKEVSTMDAEELKDEITKELKTGIADAVKEAVGTSVSELKTEIETVKKATEELQKKPEEEEPDEDEKKKKEDEEEMAAKKKKDKDYEYPEAKEMVEVLESINSIEELSSWKELVKKHGVKEAKKLYKSGKGEKEEVKENKEETSDTTEVDQLKEEIKSLKEKLDEPEEKKVDEKSPDVNKMSQRELDARFLATLQEMNGMKVTALDQIANGGGI